MKYEKPSMTFTAMQTSHAIADKCWSYVNSGGSMLYTDTPGKGYAQVSFNSVKGCKQVTADNVVITALPAGTPDSDAIIAKVKNIISSVIDNGANPYHGSPFVTSIDPSWS